MENEHISEQESLRIIEEMINTAKSQFSENGHLYLLWGWLVLGCSIAQFVLFDVFHSDWHWTVWLLTWVAVVYQYFYFRRKQRRRQVRTYTEDILATVWLAFIVIVILITAVLLNIFLARHMDFYLMLNPVLLLVYGVPTFVSGSILKFRPLQVGGIVCWILGVVTALLPQDYAMLMLAPAMLFAWIIPGYLLRARYRKNIRDGF